MALQTIKRTKFAEIFNKPSLNKQEAKKFIAKYTVDYLVDGISLPENFELKSNRRKTIIRLLDRNDKNNPRIAYAVDIKISEETIGHRSCTQILVWASPNNEDLLIGLPRKIVNHLLKTYTIMVTDQEQTPDGKRFWERRISQAFKDKNFVYFLDKTSSDSQHLIEDEDDFFENYEAEGWGDDKLHKDRLYIISAAQIF
jgi:hypothetical protein